MTPDEAAERIANLKREKVLEAKLRALSEELLDTPRPTVARVVELREALGQATAEVWRLRRERCSP